MKKFYTYISYSLFAFALFYAIEGRAQYTFSPSTTLIKYQARNSLTYDSIHIANNSADTLFMKWELLQNDTMGGCYFDFCSSGECWLGIPATGSFAGIKPGGFGWAGVHLWTGNLEVTSTARIYIYKDGYYSTGDTLTYILHSVNGNGIDKKYETDDIITVYPIPASNNLNITIDNKNSVEIPISLYNILGERVYTTKNSKNNLVIPLDKISDGVYFLTIKTDNRNYTKKIVIYR